MSIVVISATVIAIYAAKGYRIIGTEIVTTAILKIESDPRGAQIILDGEVIGSTPRQIVGLVEGNHYIEIQRDGFTKWQKDIFIDSGTVRELSIKLFPTELNLEQITTSNVDQVFFSDDGKVAIYTVSDENYETGIWRIIFNKPFLDFTSREVVKLGELDIIPEQNLTDDSYYFSISENNQSALLTLSSGDENMVYVLNNLNTTYQTLGEPLNETLGYSPKNIYWHNNDSTVLIDDDNLLASFNLRTNRTELLDYKGNNSKVTYSRNTKGEVIVFKSVDSDSTISDAIEYTATFEVLIDERKEVFSIRIPAGEEVAIADVFLTNTADPSFYFSTASSLYFYHSELDLLTEVTSDFDSIISVSPLGTGALYTDNTLVMTAFVKPDIVQNDIDVVTYSIGERAETKIFQWYAFNDSILEYNSVTQTLRTYDVDGANTALLLEDIAFSQADAWGVDVGSQQLTVSVVEESTIRDHSPETNLYRLDLQ